MSKTLAPITKVQKKWAFQNCFEHKGIRNAKGFITCLDCGHSWKGGSELGDTLFGAQFPKCSAKLKVETTRKRVFKQSEYFSLITTKEDFQVLRFFLVQYHARLGEKAHYFISEVVQRWIAPSGKYETIARTRPLSYYEDTWNFSSKLEIRPEREHHHINPTGVYPRQRVIPELKRGGYKNQFENLNPFDIFRTMLLDCRAETLLKTGQKKVLRYFAGKNLHKINDYWASIKICIRNGYYINDVHNWRDYIDLLRFFGKDLHNAKYVCPTDLNAEHDRYVKKKRDWQERVHREEKKKKALESEKKFHEMKSRFFGIQFTDGLIQIRMLESVEDVMQEGDILHHCVFVNNYHLRPDSLILSACIGDKRIETIEFSLSKMQIVQCRGVHNQNREYHDQIIALVKKNKRLIQRRMVA